MDDNRRQQRRQDGGVSQSDNGIGSDSNIGGYCGNVGFGVVVIGRRRPALDNVADRLATVLTLIHEQVLAHGSNTMLGSIEYAVIAIRCHLAQPWRRAWTQ